MILALYWYDNFFFINSFLQLKISKSEGQFFLLFQLYEIKKDFISFNLDSVLFEYF